MTVDAPAVEALEVEGRRIVRSFGARALVAAKPEPGWLVDDAPRAMDQRPDPAASFIARPMDQSMMASRLTGSISSCGAFVVLVLVIPSTLGSPVQVQGTSALRAPYPGTSWHHMVPTVSGCGKSMIYTPVHFNLSSGSGGTNTTTLAHSCKSSPGSSYGETDGTGQSNISLPFRAGTSVVYGNYSYSISIDLMDSIGKCAPTPGSTVSYCTAYSGYNFSISGKVVDVTTGSWVGASGELFAYERVFNETYCSSGTCSATHRGTGALCVGSSCNSSWTSLIHATISGNASWRAPILGGMVKGDRYVFQVTLAGGNGGLAHAGTQAYQAKQTRGWASASLDFLPHGDGLVLNSIVEV